MKIQLCHKCVEKVDEGETLCDRCRASRIPSIDWDAKKTEFHEIIEHYRGKGRKYDFLVYFSGSKDSSFVLYYMTKVLKANVLAYTWDNYLISEPARENIKNVVKTLNVDHTILKWESEIAKAVYRTLIKGMKSICLCLVYRNLYAFPLAMKNNIPIIVLSFSEGQRELDHGFSLPSQADQKKKMEYFYETWHDIFSQILKDQEPENSDRIVEHLFGRMRPYVKDNLKIDAYPVAVPMSNYINWAAWENLEDILHEINWKSPSTTTYHGTCVFEPVRWYYELNRMPRPLMLHWMSNMIHANMLTRKNAVKDLKSLNIDMGAKKPKSRISAFREIIEMDEENFEYYMERNKIPMTEQIMEQRRRALNTIAWHFGVNEEILNELYQRNIVE